MIAMILKYGRDLSEYQAKGDVKEAVITVPSYFTQEKREMMIQAADLAGLRVEQLVHGSHHVGYLGGRFLLIHHNLGLVANV